MLSEFGSDDRVHGVLVFGSVARREAGPDSDVDVLVVHVGAMPDDLADLVPDNVSIAFYTPKRLRALPQRSPLFAIHLALEGIVLHDRAEELTWLFRCVKPLDTQTLSRLARGTKRRLDELLGQPRGLYLDPHAAGAELFALAKQGAMLLAAADATYEFNRHRALNRAYEHAELAVADRDHINGLESLWQAARRGDDDPDACVDLEAASAAVYRLLAALVE